MCQEQTGPFSVACNAMLCSRSCSAQPASRWLVGRLSALASRATPPRLALTPRTRRMQRCGRPYADYECGVGLLRLNQLNLVTVVASSATVPKKRNCAFTRSNSSRNLDFLNAFASPLQVAKRSNCAFSTVRGQRLSPAVDNDSLEVTTSTRSRTRSSRRDGWCAWHARPSTRRRGWTSSATEAGAAQQEQPPWLHDVNHTYHRTHLLLSAALHDLTPHLLSIASSGSPECRMRCAIAHF